MEPRDVDLVPVFVLMWSVSAIRVAASAWSHEPFGVTPTLAAIALVVFPWLLREPLLLYGRKLLCRRAR